MVDAGRLQSLISAVRKRWFMTVALRAAGCAMAAAAAPLIAALIVYKLFAPVDGALLLLAASGSALAVAAAWVVGRRIESRPDDARVARFIEERAGSLPDAREMDDALVSAVRVSALPAEDPRAPFATLVIGGALKRLEGIDASAIVPPVEVRRAVAIGGVGASLLMLVLMIGAPALGHAYETARLRLFPGSISVEVLPGDARVVAGRPLTISARVNATGGPLARATPKLVVSIGADERTVDMRATANGFEFPFESVDRSFKYRVLAGTASSGEYNVTALFPPRVKRIDLHYQYPAFTGQAPRTEEDGGDILAPEGTRVRLRIHTDKPVVSGQLGLTKGGPALTSAGERMLEADLVIARNDSYRIRLLDRDGLSSSGDSEYFIRLMEDRPPDVRILRPSADQGITPLQEVAIEARAEDDYGIVSLDLVYSVAGGEEHVVPFSRVTTADTERTGAHLLAAEELKVRPGDVITYYAKARDVARGRRSIEVKSDIFFLEVRPFNEEFVAAQSQAGAGAGGDPQVDSLIQAQKDIISATWNIERRAAGGRSSDDIQAVAKAQADLRARAERVLGAARGRRGRGFFPQRQAQPPRPSARTEDPIPAALEAMAQAAERLGSERTREAIPHELSALNGLLQLQAEVRRRQITQQARGAGSGGGNRQSQDLSALFDKELQRQQRTNYEQRSQVEERQNQQQPDQDMLDRVRDLARRQEELNRQQRELAQQAQAEERRRQLERLAREQQELQRETEELSKQMEQRSGQRGQQSQQPGQQGQQSGQQSAQQGQQQGQGQSSPGSPQPGNPGMRSAAEQMGRAAGDMRRADEESAARNGERAAGQLRNLEQQMRGGADARQRAAADLQAEAQQIAQEQRRIAAEAERMAKGGDAGGTDARRRLAADKDRLSDRVDSLQREAQRQGGAPPQGRSGESPRTGSTGTRSPDEQMRAREAAAELQRQKVGERMRETAQQLREGAKPADAQGEQQIARTLDQVVEKLGGSSADARRLAEQLDRSKEIRERLDQLEGQLRQAEARKDGSAGKLRQAYEQELGRARDSLGRQGEGVQPDGGGGSTPEEQVFSRSAPGTEAFKQDRSGWEALRKNVDRALEQHDAAVSLRLAKALGDGGLHAGGSDRVPEQYRHLVAKYYESLAKVKK